MNIQEHHVFLRNKSFELALKEITERFPSILAKVAVQLAKNPAVPEDHTISIQSPSIETGGLNGSALLIFRSARDGEPAYLGLEVVINTNVVFYLAGTSSSDEVMHHVDTAENNQVNLNLTEIELVRRTVELLEQYVSTDAMEG